MKTILVPTQNIPAMKSTLETAVVLAQRTGAYVEGVPLWYGVPEFVVTELASAFSIETYRARRDEDTAGVRKLFETFMQEHGIAPARTIADRPSFGWFAEVPPGEDLVGSYGTDGAMWCYDPTNSDKGQHGYPYRYQAWAYDLNDFAAVKAGTKQPWEVVPYAVWPLDFPTPEATVRLGGVAYDAQRQLLYISQTGADPDGYAYRPVIHVFRVNASPSAVRNSSVD